MLLSEVFDDELLEVQLSDKIKKRMKAATLAGSIGAASLANVLTHNINTSDHKFHVDKHHSKNTELPLPPPKAPNDHAATKQVNYPQKLDNISNLTPEDRINTFKSVFLPFIIRSDLKILATRHRIEDILKKKEPTKNDKEFLSKVMKTYGASDYSELLRRVDIIPLSLALSQAAIESSFGANPMAKKADVFYGQKNFSGNDIITGPKGANYSAFANPEQSVEAYMLNLNTNPAYAEFRNARAKYRDEGRELRGQLLALYLQKYSTRGRSYVHQINQVIHDFKWFTLDKMVQ